MPGQAPKALVVLSDEAWQTFFAGDPKVIGQTLRGSAVNQPPSSVSFRPVCTVPANRTGAQNGIPGHRWCGGSFSRWRQPSAKLTKDSGGFNYKVIARLKSGVTLSQATAELDGLQNAYALTAHLPFHLGIALTPLDKDVASGVSGGVVAAVEAAVGAVLLIACVNLANLNWHAPS